MALKFTTVQHDFRKESKLSCNEYVLLDMIYILSNNSNASISGWCYMTREKMAEEVGLTKQAIIAMIDRLIAAGFLEKEENRKYLRTTPKWHLVYFTNGKVFSQNDLKNGNNTLLELGKESLPYNNSLDNNKKDNNKVVSPIDLLKSKKDAFYSKVMDYKKKNPDRFPNKLYQVFFDYWSEPAINGKQIRYDAQRYFEIGKRLSTFKNNTSPQDLSEMWLDHEKTKKEAERKNDLFSN